MQLFDGLKEYQYSMPWPDRRNVKVQLQGRDLALALDMPDFGVEDITEETVEARSLTMRVVLAHASFRAAIQAVVDAGNSFYKRCTGEVNAITLFFPGIKDFAIRVAFAAWLAFACVMDDILESLDPVERQRVLLEAIQIIWPEVAGAPHGIIGIREAPNPGPAATDKRIQDMTRQLIDHTSRYLSRRSAPAFFSAVVNVLDAHVKEVQFLQSGPPMRHSMAAYLALRRRTIALNPFFEVLKAELLDPNVYNQSTGSSDLQKAWIDLQTEVSQAAGLQNDLIGLVRDIDDGEELNAVIVLMHAFGWSSGSDPSTIDRSLLVRCLAVVNSEHNASVARAMDCATRLHRAAEAAAYGDEVDSATVISQVEEVSRHVLLLAETHLRWCAAHKRYRLEVSLDDTPTPTPSSSPRASHSLPANLETERSQTVTETMINGTDGSQMLVLRKQGILHGLPVYPSEESGLTALITGATGLSGYSMVKALAAAPQRWRKIYCLSSRVPPQAFFEELGEGAARVEHIPVDFLGDPNETAKTFKEKIGHVDYIFYFSYVHLPPEGNNLWSNADQLAAVNVTLFTNFLTALQLSNLYPRRFILQTGTKHYAFYLGPAAVPAFETDPRVIRAGDRNFYYEQEDLLTTFCQNSPAGGTTYAISRPNYIIGAAASRDGGALNHLLGIAVYAAVQAKLGDKFAFPGGYDAWDKEQSQSSAVLNAVFAEWLALADIPANEPWNVHDGLSFTWGRLWPSIAKWFGVEWAPPEVDETKYRVFTMPGGGESTPRGYGTQMTFRSTFTLLEWAQQPHVEAAWQELMATHGLIFNPFETTDARRTRVFGFSDSAIVGDLAMTISVRKAREHGFFGTVDSFHTAFLALKEMARLKMIPPLTVEEYTK